MKLFGRFKATAAAPQPAPVTYGIPTVNAGPDLFAAYRDVFHEEMPHIKAITASARKEIYSYIANGENGYLNQGRYHKHIFDNYFSAINWRWPEYDRWEDICLGLAAWPVSWPTKYRRTPTCNSVAAEVAYRKHLYAIFMRTIHFRAKSLADYRRQTKVGLTRELMVVFPEDQRFVDLARAHNRDALPPLFPFDLSLYKVIIPALS